MKNKLFIDTNVMLDLLGERKPFYDSIAKITTLAENNQISMIGLYHTSGHKRVSNPIFWYNSDLLQQVHHSCSEPAVFHTPCPYLFEMTIILAGSRNSCR